MSAAVAEIKTHIVRLEDLVQDYLSLARVAHLERTPHDLGAMVQSWALDLPRTAAAHGVPVHLVGTETLGQVVLHASTLRRAVLNLIQNALDAMPQGGTLTLEGQGMATQVQLHVRDTGSGIPAAHLEQIFEPLYTTKPEGTGLGLYIAQEIVAAHGGQLRCRWPRPGDKWYLDEVFLTINGKRHYLWRAVDQDDNVLDILVHSRRNKKAAKKFFRKLLKGLYYVPRVLITDKLKSYTAAKREVMPGGSIGRVATSIIGVRPHIGQHFHPRQHLLSASVYCEPLTYCMPCQVSTGRGGTTAPANRVGASSATRLTTRPVSARVRMCDRIALSSSCPLHHQITTLRRYHGTSHVGIR
jgi:hypothetical protein